MDQRYFQVVEILIEKYRQERTYQSIIKTMFLLLVTRVDASAASVVERGLEAGFLDTYWDLRKEMFLDLEKEYRVIANVR